MTDVDIVLLPLCVFLMALLAVAIKIANDWRDLSGDWQKLYHRAIKERNAAEDKLSRILTPLYKANAHRRLKSQLTKSLQQETTRRLREGV